jgi:hypothetical protein
MGRVAVLIHSDGIIARDDAVAGVSVVAYRHVHDCSARVHPSAQWIPELVCLRAGVVARSACA